MPLDPGGLQACVWLTCPLRGKATTDDRCPQCGKPTESRADFAGGALADLRSTGSATELIATTDGIPGYQVTEFRGDVVGVVVVSRSLVGNLGAGLQAVGGGEIDAYSSLLLEARHLARRRMWDDAREIGANSVVGMRYSTSTTGDAMVEVAAYGTAVVVARTPGPPAVVPPVAPGPPT